MGESLKTLMGDAYHDGITVDEVEAFIAKGKYVDLGSGKYVDKSKYDRVEQDLSALKESTKDYETIKTENATFKAEKEDATLKETLVKYGIDPESFRYVKGDITEKVFAIVNDEAKDKKAVEDYLKSHPQFAKKTSNVTKNKVVTTKVENEDKPSGSVNATINDNFRRALGKKVSTD